MILLFIFSIGYPVVTLGFGFKSYVGYRMRQVGVSHWFMSSTRMWIFYNILQHDIRNNICALQRKQKDVAKENDFYLQLLQQALPLEQQAMSMQQIQPQVQSQTHVTASLEQHVKTQTHKLSPQYNPSPEKSRGSLYLLSIFKFRTKYVSSWFYVKTHSNIYVYFFRGQ